MSEKIHDTPDLMGKRITGIGHKPWRDWSEAQPVLIADNEQLRVTRDAYFAINFRQFNNELWPRRWHDGYCIWTLEIRLFDIFEYDSRCIPERMHADLPYSLYSVTINTQRGSLKFPNVKARTQMEAEIVACERAEKHIRYGATFDVRKIEQTTGPNNDLIDIERDNE
jgi:hypothetical protein